MPKLSQIFRISHGNKLDYNKMLPQKGGVAFISRSAKNNGIVDYVKECPGIPPFPGGYITVTLGGTLLSAFIQEQPFYTAQNIAVLSPKADLSKAELLYYCTCLEFNRYRYSTFGREANVSLGEIELPDKEEIPDFVKTFSVKQYGKRLLQNSEFSPPATAAGTGDYREVPLFALFEAVSGVASSQVERSETKPDAEWLPYIRPSYRQETGVDAYVGRRTLPPDKIFPAGTLYVSTDGQGSHTYAYVSAFEFVPNSNVSVLLPKREMDIREKLYYAHCITANRYKFSYGRKPKGERLGTVMLPEYPPQYVGAYRFEKIMEEFGAALETS